MSQQALTNTEHSGTEDKAKKANDSPQQHDWLDFFLREFRKESDRAAVILTSAMLDDSLRELLEATLLPCSSSEDPLFDGANAPLASFSARIEAAHRLGLISRQFARCLHIVRKIRNSFAHDVAGCSFASQSVASRVEALKNATRFGKNDADVARQYSAPRESFSYVTGFFLWQIKLRTKATVAADDDGAVCCQFSIER